jgi:hypothetical protein
MVWVSEQYWRVSGGGGGGGGDGDDRGAAARVQSDYHAAKFKRDHNAAARIVDRFAKDQWLDAIVDDVFASGAGYPSGEGRLTRSRLE